MQTSTWRRPRTPASSRASRQAASSTVSSVSQPPCKQASIPPMQTKANFSILACFMSMPAIKSKSAQAGCDHQLILRAEGTRFQTSINDYCCKKRCRLQRRPQEKGRFSAHAKHELQDQGKQKGTNRASCRILADL